MISPQLFTIISLFFCASAISQNQISSTGNVGIGTTSPETPLHVIGESRFDGSGWFSRNNNGSFATALSLGQNNGWDKAAITISTSDQNGQNHAYWTSWRDAHTLTFQRQSPSGQKNIGELGGQNAGHYLMLYSAGDGTTPKLRLNSDVPSFFTEGVGIGATNPESKLHIHTTAANDGLRITHATGGIVRLQANSLVNLAWNDITKEGDAGIIFGNTAGQNLVDFGFVLAPWRGGGPSGLRVDQSGVVSIGTRAVDPNSKLLVDGTVRARKVKVDQSSWPDYVFEQEYILPSLTEVEAFIRQHKRLPGVASEKEVTQQGLDLGENQSVLLKKIEELTLYIIQQQKEIEELKKKNESIEDIKNELEKLKKKIGS